MQNAYSRIDISKTTKTNVMLYFIAILTPHTINHQILEWKTYMLHHFNCKAALKSPAHITLIPPFSMRKEQEKQLTGILQTLSHPRFPITLKNFNAFKPRVIFVHVEPGKQLQELKTTVENALTGFPIKKETRPFHPHVTIANRDLEKEDFPKAWEHFKHINYEAVFDANNISLLRHNGAKWEIAYDKQL
jgi:2'-5' RNA ligase